MKALTQYHAEAQLMSQISCVKESAFLSPTFEHLIVLLCTPSHKHRDRNTKSWGMGVVWQLSWSALLLILLTPAAIFLVICAAVKDGRNVPVCSSLVCGIMDGKI